jgi:hypothetical protein
VRRALLESGRWLLCGVALAYLWLMLVLAWALFGD